MHMNTNQGGNQMESTDIHAELAQAEKELAKISSQRKPLPPYSEVKAARARVAELKSRVQA